MNLPKMQRVGDELPRGWQRPTTKLVAKHKLHLQEGLAAPSAPHLYRASRPATPQDLRRPLVSEGVQMLEAYVRPGSGSALTAVGMAYPQLARASAGSFRALAAQSGMPDLRIEHVSQKTVTLINPTYKPVRPDGQELQLESCFSAPGIGVRIMRWRTIILYLPGERPRRVTGTDAWILQHEIDHLSGHLCTTIATQQRQPLYFVPPEWEETFFRGAFDPSWPVMPAAQYAAMKSGAFDLATYAQYL